MVDNIAEKPVCSKTSSSDNQTQIEGEASIGGKGSQHIESGWNGQYKIISMVLALQ